MALPARTITDQERPLHGLALCAGFGGLELGLHIAEPEYRTVCFVEREVYAAATLVARMADEALDNAPVWDDVNTFDGKAWRGKVDILTAGYPCQPFTYSGLRRGKNDPRHLWPQVARIIDEAQPAWVFCENVEGHLDMGFSEVAGDLQALGFEVKAGLFSASEVGASHSRRRLFILAHADSAHERKPGRHKNIGIGFRGGAPHRSDRQADRPEGSGAGVDVHVAPDGSHGVQASGKAADIPLFAPAPCDMQAWHALLKRRPDLKPELFRPDHGLADRMERVRAAGNGVVPLAAAFAYQTLRADFAAAA